MAISFKPRFVRWSKGLEIGLDELILSPSRNSEEIAPKHIGDNNVYYIFWCSKFSILSQPVPYETICGLMGLSEIYDCTFPEPSTYSPTLLLPLDEWSSMSFDETARKILTEQRLIILKYKKQKQDRKGTQCTETKEEMGMSENLCVQLGSRDLGISTEVIGVIRIFMITEETIICLIHDISLVHL